jgi:membrane protein implicated in regulation of membrane protease activity
MAAMFWIWLAAAVVFLILELTSPTFVFACFVAGSLVAGVYSYFSPEAYYWQIGIFIIVTVVLLPLTRGLARRITRESPQRSNVDALIGRTALVIRAIDPDLGGQVRIEGETWKAVADERIDENTKVEVLDVSGTKVHVRRLKEERDRL